MIALTVSSFVVTDWALATGAWLPTMMSTGTGGESAVPSLAMTVKLSGPLAPALGV